MPDRKPPRRGETGNGFIAPPRGAVERRRRISASSTTAASVVRSLAACAQAWASNSSRMSTVAFTVMIVPRVPADVFGDGMEQAGHADPPMSFGRVRCSMSRSVASGTAAGLPSAAVCRERCGVRGRPRAGGRPRGSRSGSRCRRSSRRRWPVGCSSRPGSGWSRRRRPRRSRAAR